jgi:hypothetical protein
MWHVWGTAEACTGFWWGNLREGDHSEDTGVDRRIIYDGSSRSGIGGMDWIDLARGRDEWRAIVISVMDLRVS